MRILIYGLNYSPELTGVGKYSGEMADWLALQGHEIRVVTAPPYYPEWAVHPGFSGSSFSRSSGAMAGGSQAVVYRCPLWVPQKPGGFTRLLHLFSFAASSSPLVLAQCFWRPDVVLVIAPTLFCAPAGWLAARLCGARAWLHIQDFEVDAAFSLGILKNNLLRRLVLATESILLRRFDRVSSISFNMVQRLSGKGVLSDRQITFPNWVDLEAIHPLPAVSPMRAEFGIAENEVMVLYSGNMGEKQGLDILLDAADSLAAVPGLRFVMCGEGAERRILEQKYRHLTNVAWLPLQPMDRLNDLLNAADIHALPQRGGAADLVMPSKLTGMMASGRPTVAAAVPGSEIARAVEGAGILAPPGDVASFAAAIVRLAADSTLRKTLGEAARTRAVATMGKAAVLADFLRNLEVVSETA